MKYIRFYYFSFLYFYRDRPESWIAEYRSMFLVLITVTSTILLFLLILYPNLEGIYGYSKLAVIIFFITAAAILQQHLIANERYKLILEEFTVNPMNTKSNRIACWTIWVLTFIAPMILAVVQKGFIR